MPPHNSSDSWIDLSEIAKLVEQLMPEDGDRPPPPPPQLPPLSADDPPSPSPLDDAPISLVPEIPSAWEKSSPDSVSSFPSLDDLEVSEVPEGAGAESEPESADEAEGNVVSMQSKVRADETLARISRLGRNSAPSQEEECEPFLKAEPDADEIFTESEPAAQNAETNAEIPVSEQKSAPEETLAAKPDAETVLYIPKGSLRVRLQAYEGWVCEVTDCSRFQITDGQGYSLMEDESKQDATIVASALQLMSVLGAVGPKMGGEGTGSGVYLPLDAERWLCVLGCETRYGPVCLSMVTRAPLSGPAADELTRTLRRTLESVG